MWKVFSKNIPPQLFIVLSLWNADFSIKNANYNYFLSCFPRREAKNLASFQLGESRAWRHFHILLLEGNAQSFTSPGHTYFWIFYLQHSALKKGGGDGDLTRNFMDSDGLLMLPLTDGITSPSVPSSAPNCIRFPDEQPGCVLQPVSEGTSQPVSKQR